MQNSVAKKILKFWFGEDDKIWPEKDISRNWFLGGKPFDDAVNHKFGDLLQQMLKEDLIIPDNNEELLASIIVLDQFTRNTLRGSAEAFSGDKKSLKLSMHAVETGIHLCFPAHQRIFLYMPFEHSEELSHQQTCVRLFEEMLEEVDSILVDKVSGFYSFAKEHRDIIEEFNRFPHRNKVLGRESTVEELEYLVKGKTFGQ